MKLKLIQLGLGPWGGSWYRDVVGTVKEVELVGLVEKNPKTLSAARRARSFPAGKCFKSLNEAFKKTEADAVLAVTATPYHAPVVEAALKAGKHVLVEKPFTYDMRTAKKLVGLAGKKGLKLMVSQNYRHEPAIRALQKVLGERRFGTLHAVNVDFNMATVNFSIGPDSDPAKMPNMLMEMAIHLFDLMRALMGREPTAVYTAPIEPRLWRHGNPCAFFTTVHFGKVPVHLRFSWGRHGPKTTWGGTWGFDCDTGYVLAKTRCAGPSEIVPESITLWRDGQPAEMIPLPHLKYNCRAACLAEFARAVLNDDEPETSGRDNLGTLRLAFAAFESGKKHAVVPLT